MASLLVCGGGIGRGCRSLPARGIALVKVRCYEEEMPRPLNCLRSLVDALKEQVSNPPLPAKALLSKPLGCQLKDASSAADSIEGLSLNGYKTDPNIMIHINRTQAPVKKSPILGTVLEANCHRIPGHKNKDPLLPNGALFGALAGG